LCRLTAYSRWPKRKVACLLMCREAELGHHDDRCSFDAFLDRYKLDDPALRALALVVRGADTDRLDLVPEAAGLFAIATGFQRLMPERFADDDAMLAAEMPMYDALYEFFRAERMA
jgi:hypothetical protein